MALGDIMDLLAARGRLIEEAAAQGASSGAGGLAGLRHLMGRR